RLADECGPEIIVTEIALSDGSGIDAARKITARQRKTGLVFLSGHSDVAYVVSSMKAGGRGYVLKDTADRDLCEAIYAVSGGSTFHSPVITWLLAQDCQQRLKEQRNRFVLSEEESEVIQHLAKGKTSLEIAPSLGLDPSAVEALRFLTLQKVYLGHVEPNRLTR